MAERIRQEVGVKAKLIRGGGGIFDVVVDGRKVFSKFQTGRFPEPEEVISQLGPAS
ncbi:MAG: Rdx family protein [Phycisphaerae bacterium]|nr:Rdx family protein [Phycisphaerae bacterium]